MKSLWIKIENNAKFKINRILMPAGITRAHKVISFSGGKNALEISTADVIFF